MPEEQQGRVGIGRRTCRDAQGIGKPFGTFLTRGGRRQYLAA
jgi:hypothetical protein